MKGKQKRLNVERLWGERFDVVPPREIIEFLSGRDVRGLPPCDERLIPYDLWGSRAHVLMLWRQGILSKRDAKKILQGLRAIGTLHERGRFALDPSKEDVHSNVESFLIQRLGIEYGGKVHTGRSRNDQVALDMRLYLRDEVLVFVEGLLGLAEVLLQKAEEHGSTPMPGYTHHQRATATTFGHLLLSFVTALERDVERFLHWFLLFNKNPLGAAAGYGTSFDLDRVLTSRLLGFDGPTENVLDPVTQRWEPEAELAYDAAAMMNHLSGLAQTLILLSTEEFGMISLDDRHCSGSSIMPQKRNPDVLEVIKAKASYAQGVLVSLLSVGKGLFTGYNRDTQWTKYWIMELVDESKSSLPVMTEVIRLLRVDRERMLDLAGKGFIGATPLMEWIVRSWRLPMRKAKMILERAVRYSEKEGGTEISYEAFQKALRETGIEIQVTAQDLATVQRPEWFLSHSRSVGTASERRVKEAIAFLRRRVGAGRSRCLRFKARIEKARGLTAKMEKERRG